MGTIHSADITYAIWKTEHTVRQTDEYSSGQGILMFDYFSSMVYSLLEKMIFGQLVMKFSAVYGTQLYIKMLTASQPQA